VLTATPPGAGPASGGLSDSPRARTLGKLTGHTGPVTAAEFSPDGTRIATASATGELWLWNARILRRVRGAAAGDAHGITSLAFSPCGGTIAAAVPTAGAVRVYSSHPLGAVAVAVPLVAPPRSLAFAPRGRYVAASTALGVVVVDSWTGTVRGAAATDSAALAIAAVANPATGTPLVAVGLMADAACVHATTRLAALCDPAGLDAPVSALCISSDGGTVVTGSAEGQLVMWAGERGTAIPLAGR
jgi:WD40 repeat protein